ncbi:methyltransferase domain-containing protein [Phyllosticta capitalensis]|uniref:methyltransferase domain-containing protein n=1 Tax=Phyllosticta capitalensis TaxID=121624 RepID=UPI003131BB67
MTSSTAPAHLDPSALGTRAYWDSAYEREIANHTDSGAADEGTVWFADAGAEERVCGFLEDWADEGRLVKEKDDGDMDEEGEGQQATSFLDLGTGNGHLLFALRDDGWEGRMVGVDYSARSVELARQIQEARKKEKNKDDEEQELDDIMFEELDILDSAPGVWLRDGFDVVLDKGTFDAISLSGETDAQGRRVCEGYRERVEPLVKRGGVLLITSCNWTADELKGWFEVEGGELVYEDAIRYPSFTFGGKTGQQVCSLAFRRKAAA